MNVCCSCFGTGTVTCFSCGGRKKHLKFKSLDGRDISTCLICGGRGILPCRVCNSRHSCSGYTKIKDWRALYQAALRMAGLSEVKMALGRRH